MSNTRPAEAYCDGAELSLGLSASFFLSSFESLLLSLLLSSFLDPLLLPLLPLWELPVCELLPLCELLEWLKPVLCVAHAGVPSGLARYGISVSGTESTF